LEVWGGVLTGGEYIVGLVNRGQSAATITASFERLLEGTGLSKLALVGGADELRFAVRDLWKRRDLGSFQKLFVALIPGHDIGLYRLSPLAALTDL
jgi:alpha-galactosidase